MASFDRAAKKLAAEKGFEFEIGATPSFADVFKAAHDTEMYHSKPKAAPVIQVKQEEPRTGKKSALQLM